MNQDKADSAMPSTARVGEEDLVVHVLNAADRRMRTNERDCTEGFSHREESRLSGECLLKA